MPLFRLFALLVMVMVLAACERPQEVPAVSHDDTASIEPAGAAERYFACGDELAFSVRFVSDTAYVRLPESELSLPQVPSASGARYAADGYELHTRSDEAAFTTPNASYRDCSERDHHSVWEDARNRGVSFRAVGQEPGWLLEVADSVLIVETDYGSERNEAREYTRENDSQGFTLHAAGTSADIRVEVIEEQCVDTMSGERFEASVRLFVDDRELAGCGRHLD
jgi:uncharacterized membrane protein